MHSALPPDFQFIAGLMFGGQTECIIKRCGRGECGLVCRVIFHSLRNTDTQTAAIKVRRFLKKIVNFHFTFCMFQHTSSEVTGHCSVRVLTTTKRQVKVLFSRNAVVFFLTFIAVLFIACFLVLLA